MKPRFTLATAAGLLAFSACTPEPASGVVTEKEYEPAHTITTQNCTTRYDSKGRYAGQTCYPSNTYYPECWEVDYEDAETDTSGKDCVSEDLFNSLEIGDYYEKDMN